MPNFVWPPPFLPPPIAVQPPPIPMPDMHFFPFPPHHAMTLVPPPMMVPMPAQLQAPPPVAVPTPPRPKTPPPQPAQKPERTEQTYQTVTTTTFIPVGTISRTEEQKPKKKTTVEPQHDSRPQVANGSQGEAFKQQTDQKEQPLTQPINAAPPSALIESKPTDETHYHYHSHRFSEPSPQHSKHRRKVVSVETKKAPDDVKLSKNTVIPQDGLPLKNGQGTMQTLAEIRDAIKELQLVEAALLLAEKEAQAKNPNTVIETDGSSLPVPPQKDPETGFHYTKPTETVPDITATQKPLEEPTLGPATPNTLTPSQPIYAAPANFPFPYSHIHGCPPFFHQNIGYLYPAPPYPAPQYSTPQYQFPVSHEFFSPNQPRFSHSAYQTAEIHYPEYLYPYHPNGMSFTGVQPNPSDDKGTEWGKHKENKQSDTHSRGHLSDSDGYYAGFPRRATEEERMPRGRQRVLRKSKESSRRQEESSEEVIAILPPAPLDSKINCSASTTSDHKNVHTGELISRSETQQENLTAVEAVLPVTTSTEESLKSTFPGIIRAGALFLAQLQNTEPVDASKEGQGAAIDLSEEKKQTEVECLENNTAVSLGGFIRPYSPESEAAASDTSSTVSNFSLSFDSFPQPGPSTLLPQNRQTFLAPTVETEAESENNSVIGQTERPGSTPPPRSVSQLALRERVLRTPPISPSSASIPTNPLGISTREDLEEEVNISGEESNTEELDPELSDMDDKEVVGSLGASIEHRSKCDCQCCEKRRNKRERRKHSGKENLKKAKKETSVKKDEEKKSKRKSQCHLCSEGGASQAMGFMTGKTLASKGERKVSNKGGMLRDVALGACAGGLGYLVGTMVDRMQGKKTKEYSHPYSQLYGCKTGSSEKAVGHAHKKEVPVDDGGGTYRLLEVPPTPPLRKQCILPLAQARPLYPGWNDPPNPPPETDFPQPKQPAEQNPTDIVVTSVASPPMPPSSDHHHHHRQRRGNRYHEEYKKGHKKAESYTINLPKEISPVGEGGKDGHIKIVIHMKNDKGECVVLEKGQAKGAERRDNSVQANEGERLPPAPPLPPPPPSHEQTPWQPESPYAGYMQPFTLQSPSLHLSPAASPPRRGSYQRQRGIFELASGDEKEREASDWWKSSSSESSTGSRKSRGGDKSAERSVGVVDPPLRMRV